MTAGRAIEDSSELIDPSEGRRSVIVDSVTTDSVIADSVIADSVIADSVIVNGIVDSEREASPMTFAMEPDAQRDRDIDIVAVSRNAESSTLSSGVALSAARDSSAARDGAVVKDSAQTNGAPSNSAQTTNGAPSNGAPSNGALTNGAPINGAAANGRGIKHAELEGAIPSFASQSNSVQSSSPQSGVVTNRGGAEVDADEAVIEVLDAEIETSVSDASGISSVRPTQPSPGSSGTASSVQPRSRPPVRLPARPRSERASASALPPPQHRSGERASLVPSAPRASARNDPWALANKTLELSHARARIDELEEFLAFRDARILTLEERLERAQQRVEELERRLDPALAARQEPRRPAPGIADLFDLGSVRPRARPADAMHSMPMPAPVERRSEVPAAELDGDDEDAEGFLDTPEPPSVAPEAPQAAAPRTPLAAGPDEDLHAITAIGARFEAALRKQGITRLSQIASWSDADVRQVAKALKIPKSRIVKGRWVEAAREAIGLRPASE